MTGGNTPKFKFKRMIEVFLKIQQNRKILESLDLKRDHEIYTKKKILNLKLNL